MVTAAALIVAAAPSHAGPWAQGRGRLYVKLSYQRLRSTTLAAPDGMRFEIPLFTRDEAALYAAYGLGERLTAIAYVPALRSSNLRDEPDELGRESGIGDVQAALQVQLGRRGFWVFAARGLVQAPTGDETRAQGLLPTGSGVWEGELVLGAGRSLAGGKAYGFVEVGHQHRGGGLRDGLVYGGQVGWNAGRRLVLAANLRGVEPYRKSAPGTAFGSFTGVSDRVTYTVYGPTAIVKLGPTTLQIDVERAFHARNLAQGTVFRAGLAISR